MESGMGERDRMSKSTQREFEQERVRMRRAQRRLVEFELVERKVALVLTVLLTAMTVLSAFAGEHLLAAAAAAGGVAAGSASLIGRRRARERG